MPPFRRVLPALLTGGALLFTSGAPAALALDGGPARAATETTVVGAANAVPAVRWENASLPLDDATHTAGAGEAGTGAGEAAPSVEEGSRETNGVPGAAGAQDPVPEVGVNDTGISVDNGTSRVEVGPDGVRVDTSGTRVEVARGSYVLVCANGVRVQVRVGEAPPCVPHPEQPEEPGYPEPEPSAPPAPGEPAPEEPEASADVPPAQPAPSPTAPVEERADAAAPSPSPSASPSPAPEMPEAVREQVLADLSPPSGQQTAGAFTPMRTMVVLVVVVAVAATGAGRAAARAS